VLAGVKPGVWTKRMSLDVRARVGHDEGARPWRRASRTSVQKRKVVAVVVDVVSLAARSTTRRRVFGLSRPVY